jgi:hypothetical protein
VRGGDLNQIPARVVEHGGGNRSHGGRFLREPDAERSRMLVALEQQLYAVGVLG